MKNIAAGNPKISGRISGYGKSGGCRWGYDIINLLTAIGLTPGGSS